MSDSSAAPWTVALQAPLSMGFLRWEHWRGAPFPPPGALPHSGIQPASPALAAGSSPLSLQGSPTGKNCWCTLRAFYHNTSFLNCVYYSNKVHILWGTVRIIQMYHNDMTGWRILNLVLIKIYLFFLGCVVHTDFFWLTIEKREAVSGTAQSESCVHSNKAVSVHL